MSAPTFSVRLADGRQFGPAAMEVLVHWAREGRVPADAWLIPADGSAPRPVTTEPALAAIVIAPPTISTGVVRPPMENVPGPALIPTKNPCALVGYYLGVFSFIPVIGCLLAVPAIILGIIGLVKRSRNPNVRGALHAWLAIILGLVGPILMTFVLIPVMSAMMS